MRKIIDGKIYDTETAEFIDSYDNNLSERDFNYVYERLYRTKKGKFFVHGEGGAMSKYSRSVSQNSWCGSEKIMALTDEEAKNWLEEHSDSETYEKYFSIEEA